MLLETGKRYVQRNGIITDILYQRKDYMTDGVKSWDMDGTCQSNLIHNGYDIVKEYKETMPEWSL